MKSWKPNSRLFIFFLFLLVHVLKIIWKQFQQWVRNIWPYFDATSKCWLPDFFFTHVDPPRWSDIINVLSPRFAFYCVAIILLCPFFAIVYLLNVCVCVSAKIIIICILGCNPLEYQCNDGMCISLSWVCDGIVDCAAQNEDERDSLCGRWGEGTKMLSYACSMR